MWPGSHPGMHVCIYMYMYNNNNTYIYTYTDDIYTCMYMWLGAHPGCIYGRGSPRVCPPRHACMYIYMYMYVYTYVYICLCGRGPHPGCIYTYVAGGRTSGANIYISIYIHIYIHVYTYMARGQPRVYMFIYGRGGPTPQGAHKYIAGGSLRYIYVFIYIYIYI